MRQLMGKVRTCSQILKNRYLQDVAFVHINKTGGSSIESALGLPFRHKTALELRKELGRARWERRFSFSFVRNPWDKVVSHYSYRVQTNQTGMANGRIEFNEWVVATYGSQDERLFDKPKMFMPQLNWITNEEGSIIVDYVGRFERLDKDFRVICEILERPSIELPQVKRSDRGDYRRLYRDESVEIVARWFASDIEQFGYAFGCQE